MRVAEMIRELRCRRGESVAEFADFLGLPEQVLFSWEFGYITPPVWTALLIARIVKDAELITLLLRDKKERKSKIGKESRRSEDVGGGMAKYRISGSENMGGALRHPPMGSMINDHKTQETLKTGIIGSGLD